MNSERQDLAMQLKSNKKYTILVSGASGIVGYGILRSLCNCDCRTIGTTIYPESPADCFADIVEIVPRTNDNYYISYLIKLIAKYHIDMIIPGIEADMKVWNMYRQELEKTGVTMLLNNSNLVSLCLDKWLFYKELETQDFEPRIRTSIVPDDDSFYFPVIIKPRCGFGARGVIKVDSSKELEQYIMQIGKSLMMQEYVGTDEEEYTVSVFFDKNSNSKAIIMLRRKLSKAGFTEIARVADKEDTESIIPLIEELARIFKPIGPTNFQFRKVGDKWKLLEINPRISSSCSIRAAFGYNECYMAVKYFLEGKEIEQPEIIKGRAVRYTEDFIFYDSDNI